MLGSDCRVGAPALYTAVDGPMEALYKAATFGRDQDRGTKWRGPGSALHANKGSPECRVLGAVLISCLFAMC